jgi:hypothetical protein
MFDFLSLYRNSSTEELLRIVQQPLLYQEAAVDAAKQILLERDVSEEQVNAVAESINREREAESQPGPAMIAQQKVNNFAKYVLLPSDNFDPKKWVYGLCAALVLQIAFSIKYYINFLQMLTEEGDAIEAGSLLMLSTWLILPLTLVLLLMKKLAGWMLAIFYSGFQVTFSVFSIINGWQYLSTAFLTFGFWMIVYFLMIRVLRRQDIILWFGGSRKVWWQVGLASVGVAVLAIIATA